MRKKRAVPRTVYVLGAGFSIPAGMPSQASILRALNDAQIRSREFADYRDQAKCFIQDAFHCTNTWVNVSLEDIYTLLDRIIASSESYGHYTTDDLRKVRDALSASITYLFDSMHLHGVDGRRPDWVNEFAESVAEYASSYGHVNRGRATDTVSFISLNWDIILDNALFEAFTSNSVSGRHDRPNGTIDYGTYFDPYDPGEDRLLVNSLVAAMRELGTVKLLKLHASMNWLYCSECGRLFVKAGQKIALTPAPCRRCETRTKGPMFPLLLTPTFIKDMSNIHIRQIWHAARLLLREAERIVFVGYSFPQADFEFRLLLNRNVPINANIEVVNLNNGENLSPANADTKNRYEYFFGNRDVRFEWGGTEQFISAETAYWRKALTRG